MSVLIRFEDKFGVARFFTNMVLRQEIEVRNSLRYNKQLDMYIEVDLGKDGVFSVSGGRMMSYKSLGVDEIVFVFDLDHSSKNDDILEAATMERNVVRGRTKCNKYGIRLRYIPVVYCAETVALYQFYTGDRRLSDLVNKVNTKALHVNLLKLLTKINSSKKVKKYDYVDYTVLRERLQKYRSIDVFNTYCISLLLDTEYESLNDQEVVDFIDRVYNHYHTLLSSNKPMKVSYKGVNIEVFSDEYKQQLKDLGVIVSDK